MRVEKETWTMPRRHHGRRMRSDATAICNLLSEDNAILAPRRMFLKMCLCGMKRTWKLYLINQDKQKANTRLCGQCLSILSNQFSIRWMRIRSGRTDSRVGSGMHAACYCMSQASV
ncbi:hypothetical protein EVAR_22334_1 [Eumeta japonica]|uniref:Uncharacterized protein n=1 Tax=Eumeta variegata TaxID=151549 RepID=A0A4C1UC05_EUMVA|nr:hypothetical protein EVAR_22334_1 [Eumeta japonica]